MTGAELVRLLAGGTHLAILNHTEAGVKDAVRNRLVALVCLVRRDLDDTSLTDIFGVGNAKLDSHNCIAHFSVSYLYV